ncbi:hypothetical protein [Ligilactobacillus murinus]|uniref:Uncharacterized protein n=2 Tax=Ligilactobacillus murinus TaxID=1622 RepID=A0AAE6WL39_9LACO|nr:hypothetical protein [Ligilactobacillus murinus]QIA91148.1 hypothetical protein FEE40_13160 [Ligilactobacillus murinus]QIA91157.1 hypothetical protein FEE40_13205 [Ligilactobacillus murinus]
MKGWCVKDMEYKVAVKINGSTKEYNLEYKWSYRDIQLPDLVLDKNGILDIYGDVYVYENEYFRLAMMYSSNGYTSEEEYIDVTDTAYSFKTQTNVGDGTFVDDDVAVQFGECQKIADWLNKEVLPDLRTKILHTKFRK